MTEWIDESGFAWALDRGRARPPRDPDDENDEEEDEDGEADDEPAVIREPDE